MATSYAQWRASSRKPARLTWVGGAEPVLCQEVSAFVRSAVSPSELGFERYFASTDAEADIWAACEQYPHPGESVRLIQVHDADALKNIGRVQGVISALSDLAGVYLLFLGALEHPAVPLVQGYSGGQVVNCSFAKDEDKAVSDKAAWLREHLPGAPDTVVWEILEMLDYDLTAVAAVCWKAAAAGFSPGQALTLAAWHAAPEYADSLIKGERKAALRAAAQLSPEETGRQLGLLAARLTTVSALQRGIAEGATAKDLAMRSGAGAFLSRKFRKHAAGYTPQRVSQQRQLLDWADSAYLQGAREGILEMLCANW